MRITLGLVFLAGSAFAQSPAPALSQSADTAVYRVVSVQDLDLVEGTLPALSSDTWWSADRPQPYAVLDGEGVAFVLPPQFDPGADSPGQATIAIRLPEPRDVSGKLFLEGSDRTLVALRFELPAASFSYEWRQAFLESARDHYRSLLDAGLPGAAWWRHRTMLFSQRAGDDSRPTDTGRATAFSARTPANMDDTFELFTGSRAVAENLQLDRILPATPTDAGEATRAIDEIKGITVAEYDWTKAVAGQSPALDPLAALIPADQHAMFFPSFQALIDVADQADEQGTPVLQALSDPSGEADTKSRYQRQLGLPMSDLARLLGPALIDSVALTGGDPYLATGSDVALVFQAKDAAVLQPLIVARVTAAAAAADPANLTEHHGHVDDVEFMGFETADRELSSFVCRMDDAVVVSNSSRQLGRLVSVSKGHWPSLVSQPEYVFFRSRYPSGAPDESALLVVLDATIRRWCGPRWRIGDSRRTRAAAALAEAQAEWIDGGATPDAALTAAAGIGEVTLSRTGARSSIYGTLAFMTPIAELDVGMVSQEEADLYSRWRDGYQQNWSGSFDPIAARFTVSSGRLAADVTVRPLIAGSDYREFVELAKGAKIAPQACDPHDGTLLHWALAIDKQSSLLGSQASMLSMMLPNVDALGWLGQSVALFADDDPFWDELAAAEDAEDFLQRNWPRLPLGLHAEVGNGLLLTGFLVGLRGLVEQSAPDMTIWENHTYEGEPYVSIRPSARAIEESSGMLGDDDVGLDRAALYYVASGDGLLFSLSQPLIERAIDRRLQRKQQRAAESGAATATAPAAPAPSAWLGEHLCVRLDAEALAVMGDIFGTNELGKQMQTAAHANLPILNEWHRLYPDEDPTAVHERLWNRRLLCPGGGSYRWNEAWQTMESSIYGHPGEKREGPSWPPALAKIVEAAAGLTFEDDGLRASFELLQSR